MILDKYDIILKSEHNLGQEENPKLRVSSYFHIYEWWVILIHSMVKEWPSWFELPAVAINTKKITVKI